MLLRICSVVDGAGNSGFTATETQPGSNRRVRIAMGIDSLTDGAVGSTYRTNYMTQVRAKYGDGGLGLSAFDDTLSGAATWAGAGVSCCVGPGYSRWVRAVVCSVHPKPGC